MKIQIPLWMPGWLERFPAFLPLIYLGYALPISVAFALINPPFQGPDEITHFWRTVQISEGHLFATRSPDPQATRNNTSGGFISRSALYIYDSMFNDMAFHEKMFHPEVAHQKNLFNLPWDDETLFYSFPNTAVYPFTSYLPAAAGLALGRSTGLSVLESFFVARLFDAFASVILCSIALSWVTRGRLVFACILSLPTTLFLFSTLSQDAMLFAYTALTVGLLNRCLDVPPEQRSPWEFAAIFFFLTLILMGRPAYFPLMLMGALIAYFGTKPSKSALAGCALGYASLAAYMLGIKHLGIFLGPGQIDIGHQESVLFHHPFRVLHLMVTTTEGGYQVMYWQFIGIFGWTEYLIPEPLYPLIGFTLIAALLSDFNLKDVVLPARVRACTLVFSVLAIGLLFVSLFLVWTPVTSTIINGMQGRYFIPLALMLTLALGNRPVSGMESPCLQLVRCGVAILSLGILVVSGFNACLACLYHYYY